jgi:hypothetical protein
MPGYRLTLAFAHFTGIVKCSPDICIILYHKADVKQTTNPIKLSISRVDRLHPATCRMEKPVTIEKLVPGDQSRIGSKPAWLTPVKSLEFLATACTAGFPVVKHSTQGWFRGN